MKKFAKRAKYAVALAIAGVMSLSVCPVGAFAEGDDANVTLKNYYTSDYDNYDDLLADGDKLEQEVYGEGIVVMKNEDNVLPLAQGSNITVFGKNSNTMSIRSSLEVAGYNVNPTLKSFYASSSLSGAGRSAYDAPGNGNTVPGYLTGETPVSMYRDVEINSFADYNDAAVVILYRMAGEGNDSARTMMWDGEQFKVWNENSTQLVPGARNKDDHYLQLDQNETDMLALAAEHFDDVIVIMQTPSSFEMGFLDDPGHYAYQENIKGAIYIGMPYSQVSGTDVLGKVMQGRINPSGRLVDTWARDFKLDPTWQNFGNQLSEYGDTKGNAYPNVAYGAGSSKGSYYNNFVTYNEGIYVGYRYWETRGYTAGTGEYVTDGSSAKPHVHGTTTTAWDNWYQAHVVYPYGHGLSYTTFTQEIIETIPANGLDITATDNITIKVKVTNTGSVAGKEVVQIYHTSPYKAGGIEKSHVILSAFDKTDLLEPGESQTLTLTFSARDMASYDYSDANNNDFKGYELEDGTYTIRLGKNAHDEWEHVDFVVDSTETLRKDPVTGTDIVNQFDEVSTYITDPESLGGLNQKYLSRNDWVGTWPVQNIRLNGSQRVIDGVNEWAYNTTRDPKLDEQEELYTTVMPTTGVKKGIKLAELNGKDFDDPMWKDYVEQFTYDQLVTLVTRGSYYSGFNNEELGLVKSGNYDTRGGLYARHSTMKNSRIGDIIILAQTFNEDLAYQMGLQVGEEALWCEPSADGDIAGACAWYAPSVNIHRSQFLGRNQQYYGEDPLLAGKLAAKMVIGAQSKGFATYVKHFAVNNQETNRIGLSTWLNEQAMREIYFKAFEITVKEGKTLGIMSALNRIGTTWAGGDDGLLNKVLRDEWGFRGAVVTDSFIPKFSNADQMIRGGGDLCLGSGTISYNANTPTTTVYLQTAAKNILYMMANTNAVNAYPQGDHKPVDTFAGTVLNTAIVDVSYSASVATATVSDVLFPDVPDTVITYKLSDGGKLPAGLTLSADGTISGIPTEEANNFRISVDATYAGYTKTAVFTLSIAGGAGSIIYQAEPNLGVISINTPAYISVKGASIFKKDATPEEIAAFPAITYSLKTGSALPSGLSLLETGDIIGQPDKECTDYEFTVLASAPGFRSVELTFSVSVHYGMTFGGGTLANGKVGDSYVQRINLATCDKPVTYSLAPGSTLPAGLMLTSGGYITGIPTESVTDFKFSVVAKADFAQSVTAEYTLSIGLSYGNLALPNATKGGEYMAYVNTAQGDFSATYSLAPGCKLPAGLTLAPTGEITGTPTEAGVFEITFVVSANGKIGDQITTTLYVAGTNPVAPEGTWTGDQVTSLALGLGLGLGLPLVASIAVLVWLLIKFFRNGGNFGGGNNGGTSGGNGGRDTPSKQMSEPKQTTTYIQYGSAVKAKAQTKPLVVFSSIFTSLFAILLAITIVLTSNEFLFNTICNVIGKGEAYIVSGSETDNDFEYYKLDDGFENKADVLAAAYELNEDICEEGFVLLKNESSALPIAKQAKVTVFGKNSVDMVLGGSGSNAGSSVGATTLYDSLTAAGIEYNPTIKTFYESTASGSGRPAPLAMGSILTGWPTGETALSDYPSNVKSSYANYNDAALVVITRVGGEGFDLPRTMFYNNSKANNQDKFTDWDGKDLIPGAKSKDAHYLELDKNEEDMLAEACANFNKVIVIINSASTMELGFVQDNANIDAALWIGAPGYSGLAALGRILTGEVTPSGATVDTHARDFTKDPTWYNFGNNMQKNGNMYPGFSSGREAYYVEYLEGIYSGYRYYETRAQEAQGTWYDENVVYPFGFGLSYTQFEYSVSHENATELAKDGKLTFTVQVKNVGTQFDGKDAIQLYYSAPYTTGKIEKAHVNLGAFAKTKTIAKNNGTDTVTLEIDVRDMASYDYDDANNNGFKGYELDAGTYTIYITDSANGAHCWADAGVTKFTFTVPNGGFKYDGSGDAKNLFDDVSGHVDEYLSRANNFANFNVLAKGFSDHKTASQDFISAFNALNKKGAVDDKTTDPWYVATMPKQSGKELNSSQTDVKLYDLIGKDYNDPLWDKLLDQITVKQMVTLISTGNFHTAAIEGIDKPETTDADGPMGFAMFMSTIDPVVYGTCYYACEVVLASTFNAQLAYDMGRMVGNEGVAGNEKGDGVPYSGWYAPAMNIHRSQFGGRNFEYYSEDGFISGVMGANVIKGANAKGVYTYCKHFVLNDQETNRDDTGLVTWANEQAMREIYFEPFEMAVKDGGTTAMMSSFNRIGITWAGGSYALLTQLLREEWGFEGMVITDYNLKAYMNTDWMIRAGGDLSLSAGGKNPARTTTSTDVASLRKATKNILFTVANSCAMNGHGPGIVWGYTLPWWVTTLIVADCVVFAAAGALWTVYALKKAKLAKAEVNTNEN